MVWGDTTCKFCNQKGLLFRDKYEYCPHYKKKYSVKADTKMFKFCNLNYRQIYAFIWCWQHKCNIGEIKNILGLSYPTVSSWLRKLRQALPASKTILSGTCYHILRVFHHDKYCTHLAPYKLKPLIVLVAFYSLRNEYNLFCSYFIVKSEMDEPLQMLVVLTPLVTAAS